MIGFVDTSGWVNTAAKAQSLAAWFAAQGAPAKLMRSIGGTQPLTPGEMVTCSENSVEVIGAYQNYDSSYTPQTGTADGIACLAEAATAGLNSKVHKLGCDLEGNYGEDYYGYLMMWLAQVYPEWTAALIELYPGVNCDISQSQWATLLQTYPGVTVWTPYPNNPPVGITIWASQYQDNVVIGSGEGAQAYDLNCFGLYVAEPAVVKTTSPPTVAQPIANQKAATAFGKRLAKCLNDNAPCDSIKVNIPDYTNVVVRPSDRTAAMHAYYYGNPKLSTCGLWGNGGCRIAGMTDAEFTAPYAFGMSVIQIQTVAQRYGVLSTGTPGKSDLFFEGDQVIIDDGSGYDAHVICITSETTIDSKTGNWICRSSEGGQFSGVGSDASMNFTRTFVWQNGGLYCGSRHVIAVARWSRLEIADPNVSDEAPAPASGPQPIVVQPPVPKDPTPIPDDPTTEEPKAQKTLITPGRLKALLTSIAGALATAATYLKAHPAIIVGLVVLTIAIVAVWLYETRRA